MGERERRGEQVCEQVGAGCKKMWRRHAHQ